MRQGWFGYGKERIFIVNTDGANEVGAIVDIDTLFIRSLYARNTDDLTNIIRQLTSSFTYNHNLSLRVESLFFMDLTPQELLDALLKVKPVTIVITATSLEGYDTTITVEASGEYNIRREPDYEYSYLFIL